VKEFFFFLLFVFSLGSARNSFATPQELVIYTYDSFVAQGGLGPEIFPLFEKKCGCRVRAIPSGDGGQLLSRLQLDAERGKPGAQIVLGIDQELWVRAKPWLESWKGWIPRGLGDLLSETQVEEGFLPFDYGVLAFMADRQALKELGLEPPSSLSDLLKPEWKRQVLLQDPRTSTPGLLFLLYSNEMIPNFWKKFRGQWLTLAQGWSQAYGLFLKKEAPLVWSYTTSQAYHDEKGGNRIGDSRARRYEAILFREGQPLQIEGAALVAGANPSSDSIGLARSFLEFLISPEVQTKIPLKNWMFPALKPGVKNFKLPPSFEALPRPRKVIRFHQGADAVKEALSQWRAIVQ
jgi:thiamine transport system substrate-binding protein